MNLASDSSLWQALAYIFSYTFLRYVLVAGGVYMLFYKAFSKQFKYKKIVQKDIDTKKQLPREIRQTVIVFLIYVAILTGVFALKDVSFYKLYFNLKDFGFGYFLASVGLAWIIHETWYYWAHKFLHTKKMMNMVHKYHHHSHNVNPFSTWALHPLEGLALNAYLLIIPVIFPISFAALLTESFLLFIVDVIWHSGYELFPKWFLKNPISKWFNTSTHHNLHHTRPLGNFSLLSNFWDRIMQTNRKEYINLFEEVTERELIANPTKEA